MGPSKLSLRGIGGGGAVQAAPPQSPESGSGSVGALRLPAFNFSAATFGAEMDAVSSGRATLGLIGLSIVALVAFYVWTHSVQGAA